MNQSLNFQHYYINSSSVIWLGNYFTTNNFEYESSTIKNIALYESTKGILLFSQFTLETPKFNITAELKLQETSLFSTMPVPLINYIVAMLLLIALPSEKYLIQLYLAWLANKNEHYTKTEMI